MRSEILLGLPLYEISDIEQVGGAVKIRARYVGLRQCPHCGSGQLRNKGKYLREVRHQNWGFRPVLLNLEARKWRCLECGRYFRDRFPGILPWQRASEAFQEMVFRDHRDGINRSCLGRREG